MLGFALAWMLTALHFCGYIGILKITQGLLRRERTPSNNHKGKVHIIVPTLEEESLICDKIRNCLALTYKDKRIWVVDGGSKDRTVELAASLGVEVIALNSRSKIAQLNAALAKIPTDDYVLVSDCDAEITQTDAIERAFAYLASDPSIGLIGGWCQPAKASALQAELAYWDKQNRLRYLETLSFSSSIVVAPFYFFPRSLLSSLPLDCVADDVFTSFICHSQKRRIVYAPEICVEEKRSPKTRLELFTHKLRKANAYSIELLRFIPLFSEMNARLKVFYGFKLFQIFFFPWTSLLLLGATTSLLLQGAFLFVASSFAFLLFLITVASYLMTPPPGKKRGGITWLSLFASLEIFLLANLVLLANFVLYPFWQQKPSYQRVGNE